jgi:hypothetical protein
MLVNLFVFAPEMVNSYGPPSACAGRLTIHLPSFAVVDRSCPSKLTVTFSPSPAVPQTGIGVPRWNTALSEKSVFGLTSPLAEKGREIETMRTRADGNLVIGFYLDCDEVKEHEVAHWLRRRGP